MKVSKVIHPAGRCQYMCDGCGLVYMFSDLEMKHNISRKGWTRLEAPHPERHFCSECSSGVVPPPNFDPSGMLVAMAEGERWVMPHAYLTPYGWRWDIRNQRWERD